MSNGHYLTAGQAAQALGVTRATLYAYVSRGQLRSEPVPSRPKERRYARQDVERLQDAKEVRRDPDRAAARGLHWGGPVLESGITLIDGHRFYYRGHDALKLADTASLEDAAALLWQVDAGERDRLFAQTIPLSVPQLAPIRAGARHALTCFQAALPIAASADPASHDLRPAAVRQTAGRIVRLAATVVTARDWRGPLHQALQRVWAPKRAVVADVIRTALVLCADHELNVSAFTARCAASAGATPYDVVSAALATLKGYKHGGAAERVLGMLERATTRRRAREVIADRLRFGEELPGFGHPLYPNGDPRALVLMRLAESSEYASEQRSIRSLTAAGAELLHERPNLDFGLAAVTRAHQLPDEAPVVLFALGRTIGWIAHAMEEYASGRLIRPRARYVGPMPT